MLNKSITDIYNMCEIENKQEYVMGVIETVENAMQSFQKLKHKLSIESLKSKINSKTIINYFLFTAKKK